MNSTPTCLEEILPCACCGTEQSPKLLLCHPCAELIGGDITTVSLVRRCRNRGTYLAAVAWRLGWRPGSTS